MSTFEAIQQVQKLAAADAEKDIVAHHKLLEAIHKLQLKAETPFDTATRCRLQPLQNLAVRMALEHGILQALARSNVERITAAELSEQTDADEVSIIRLMRMLCWKGYCEEVGENTYAANDMTRHVCTPGSIGGEKIFTETIFPIGKPIISMIREEGFQSKHVSIEDQPDPMRLAVGKPYFDFLDAHEDYKKAFDDSMAARKFGTQYQWFDLYPAEQRLCQASGENARQVLICDVGGGQGHALVRFHERFPELKGRLVVQDLAPSFKGVKLPAALEAMPHNFFDPQPIQGARLYYMRHVMHNWPDKDCRVILQHIVKAMRPDSRLLIEDAILPRTGGSFRPLHVDISMMVTFGTAMERTESHWKSLLGSADLEIVQSWTSPTGQESVIETKVRSEALSKNRYTNESKK